MNKAEFRKAYFDGCRALNLGVGEVLVVSGGAMLMHDLRKETKDVDVYINAIEFDRLWEITPSDKKKHFGRTYEPIQRYISITDKMDVYRTNPSFIHHWQLVRGVTTATLKDTLDLKKSMDRPKDQDDIVVLEKAVSEMTLPDVFTSPFIHATSPIDIFDEVYYASKPRLMSKPLKLRGSCSYWDTINLGAQGSTFRIHQKNSKLPYPHGLILLLGVVSFGTIRVFGKSVVDGTLMRFDTPGDNFKIQTVSVAEMTELLKDYTIF